MNDIDQEMIDSEPGLILIKAKNLVYYWEIDTRPHANYHTPLKHLRERICRSSLHLGPVIFKELVEDIPNSPKKEEVPEIMLRIKNTLEKYDKKTP